MEGCGASLAGAGGLRAVRGFSRGLASGKSAFREDFPSGGGDDLGSMKGYLILAPMILAVSASSVLALPSGPTLNPKAKQEQSKPSTDPAFATTWVRLSSEVLGKEVTTFAVDMGELGTVTSADPCVVVSIMTGNAKGEKGGDVLVLVPFAQAQQFVERISQSSVAGRSKFGDRQRYPEVKGTLATVGGELVIVIGGAAPDLRGKKPSELLAAQRDRG